MYLKRLQNIILTGSILTMAGPVFAQTATPVGMQYVGSQQYIGQNRTITPNTKTTKVAPQINSVYATPMKRVNEIPLYGKNKNVYFYNQPKKDEGLFAGSGLYMFAAFSTGSNNNGVNSEKGTGYVTMESDGPYWGTYMGGSDSNTDMGTANGLTLGFGRVMSDTLSVEFLYSSYNGMEYGNFAKLQDYNEIEDEEGYYYEPIINDFTYEVIDGGDISSDFIGIGLRYNLDNVFGMLGGRLKPYFGFQLGIAQNTISDYTFSDPYGYIDGPNVNDLLTLSDEDIAAKGLIDNQNYTDYAYSNGTITFIGKTTKTFGAGLELGLTLELDSSIELDFFYKMNTFGKVKTSGNVISTYDETTTDFYIAPLGTLSCDEGYTGYYNGADGTYYICVANNSYSNSGITTLEQRREESGDMLFQQYGVKLKYMF